MSLYRLIRECLNRFSERCNRLFEKTAYYLWPTLQVLWVIRVPFIVTTLLCSLFFIDQTLEALRVMAAKTSTNYNWQFGFGCVAAFFVSLGSWYFSRLLLRQLAFSPESKGYPGLLIRHTPRLLGVAVCLCFGIAAYTAQVDASQNSSITKINRNLWFICGIQLILSVLLYSFFTGRRSRLKRLQSSELALPAGLFELTKSQWVPVVFAHTVWFVLFILFVVVPVQIGQFLGPTAALILGVGTWIPIGSFISFASMRKRVPFTSAILLFAFVFTYRDCNDNHAVRNVTSGNPQSAAVSNYFNAWLAERHDSSTNDFPVFLVATEGGGIRAAYNTAMILGELQDRNPSFLNHVFAISGISGGSVGAAMITAHWKDLQTVGDTNSSLKSYATNVFTKDFLSPLLGMGLFPDLLQRFMFVPVQRFDRALGLEYAFEDAHAKLGFNSLSNSFFSWHFNQTNRLGPALLLNTTHVKSGRRMAISPFTSDSFGLSRPISLSNVSDKADVSLASAMILSARFPVFTPPGFFTKSLEVVETNGATITTNTIMLKHRFVDGGYFENSGTATLLDLFIKLQRSSHPKKCRFYLLRIGHRLPDLDNVQIRAKGAKPIGAIPQRETQGFDELSPVLALLNVREARGNSAAQQLIDAYAGAYGTNVIDFSWEEKNVPLPLGWLISRPACESLDEQFLSQTNSIADVAAALNFRK